MPRKLKTILWCLGGVAATLLAAGWWYLSPTGVSYTSSREHSQTFDAAGVQRVVLRSSKAASEVEVRRTADPKVTVEGKGTFRIDGYHGSRKDAGAGAIGRSTMEFDSMRQGEVLRIFSRETVWIHHERLYDKLAVELPEGVTLVVRPYSHDELHTSEIGDRRRSGREGAEGGTPEGGVQQ